MLAQWQSTQRSHITPMYRFVASPSLPRQTKYEDVDCESIRVPLKKNICSSQTDYVLPPFAIPISFWLIVTPSNTMLMVSSVLPSTPLLAFTGRTLLTTTASSATSHQHLPRVSSRTNASGLSPETVSGFPSYCTGSLLEIPPSNTKQD